MLNNNFENMVREKGWEGLIDLPKECLDMLDMLVKEYSSWQDGRRKMPEKIWKFFLFFLFFFLQKQRFRPPKLPFFVCSYFLLIKIIRIECIKGVKI